MMLAWHIAMLERQEKLPSLRAFLARRQPSRASDGVHKLSERLGIPVQRTRLIPREVTH